MNNSIKPWYKQFWPWFLIALPMTAVIASMITINIAFTDADGLVKDDYYKEGLAMNQDKARKRMAEELGVVANTFIDASSNDIRVSLNDAAIGELKGLMIEMIHPTRADNDMNIALENTSDNVWVGKLSQAVKPGYWWVRVAPQSDSWYVEGRIRLPEDQQVTLK